VHSGYLAIETHRDRPGIVRLVLNSASPDPTPAADGEPRIRYVARFNDGDAALMHIHEILKRRLVDLDAHLYRASLERAIAAAESIDLRHRRIYLDPEISADSKESIDSFARQMRAQRRSWAVFFQTLGYIGIGILLFNLFFLSFP
jgi:hypothetical protein